MAKKKNDNPELRGVPLHEIKEALGSSPFNVSIEGNALFAEHKQFTTRVDVSPPDTAAETDEPIRAVVRVITDIVDRPGHWIGNGIQEYASLGALTLQKSRRFLGSRLTIFENEDAWASLHLPILVAAVTSAADSIFGALSRLHRNEGPRGGESAWDEDDFDSLASIMNRYCSCEVEPSEFSAYFAVEPSDFSKTERDGGRCLFQLLNSHPHFALGGGLRARLQFSAERCRGLNFDAVCDRLNLLEMAGADLPPHFGAWRPMQSNICYSAFLPNALHDVPHIGMNVTMWAAHRARWAAKQLESMR